MRSRKSKDRQSNGQSTKKTKGQEKFEKAKGTFRSRKLKKDRQCNGQAKKNIFKHTGSTIVQLTSK
jgi:hypothetical protein